MRYLKKHGGWLCILLICLIVVVRDFVSVSYHHHGMSTIGFLALLVLWFGGFMPALAWIHDRIDPPARPIITEEQLAEALKDAVNSLDPETKGQIYAVAFTEVWHRILQHQGSVFRTIRGLPFTYLVDKESVIPSRTSYAIHRRNFEKAYMALDASGPGSLPKDVMGASYVWAILTDQRING